MPEFLTLLPPDEARTLLLSHLPQPTTESESIDVISSLNRILAQDILAPHPLPDFQRTTVDGYAVRANDTHGASDSLPAYLTLIGEVPMGDAPSFGKGGFGSSNIHTTVKQPGICRDNFSIQSFRQINSDSSLPDRRRTQNRHQWRVIFCWRFLFN